MGELAEFLLARIAEDEAAARESGADAMVGWRWKHYPPEAYEEIQALTLAHSARVLAECEAKRALVEELARMERDEMGWDGIERKVMEYLALPYASRPDFRSEWRA